MIRVVLVGLAAVGGVEAVLALGGARATLLPAAGVLAALVLLALRTGLSKSGRPAVAPPAESPPAELLQRWLARTVALIAWADGTRGDWDRHVRPVLARSFVVAVARRGDHVVVECR